MPFNLPLLQSVGWLSLRWLSGANQPLQLLANGSKNRARKALYLKDSPSLASLKAEPEIQTKGQGQWDYREGDDRSRVRGKWEQELQSHTKSHRPEAISGSFSTHWQVETKHQVPSSAGSVTSLMYRGKEAFLSFRVNPRQKSKCTDSQPWGLW